MASNCDLKLKVPLRLFKISMLGQLLYCSANQEHIHSVAAYLFLMFLNILLCTFLFFPSKVFHNDSRSQLAKTLGGQSNSRSSQWLPWKISQEFNEYFLTLNHRSGAFSH